jgi:hypothetical protein
MDLSRITVEARVRRPWEAIDLGFVLARRWWKSLFISWVIPSFALYVLLGALFYPRAWVAPLAVWWLKPFWDRAPLYIASRALFGEQIAVRQTLKGLFRLYKTDWLAWLCWRRFSLNRAYQMPITVLENLQGKPRQSRLTVLLPRNSDAASWLTVICAHLETLMAIGAISMLVLMLPAQSQMGATQLMLDQQGVMQQLAGLLSYAAMALLAPFYTTAGFALYISRRIDLEAWDIEIRFRHLAASQPPQGHVVLRSAGLIFGLLLMLPGAQHVHAATADENVGRAIVASATANTPRLDDLQLQSKRLINDVLEGDDFHKLVRSKGWRLKHRQKKTRRAPGWWIAIREFFERHQYLFAALRGLFSLGARGVEIVLWVVAISLLLLFFLRYRDSLRQFIGAEKKSDNKHAAPAVLFGLDVSQDSLPADVPTQVQALWHAEQYRAALSLLYRATLSSLMHRFDFSFNDGHTEGECAAIVKQRGNPQLSDYTEQLTHCWQQLAYGHRLPESEQVAVMCRQWWEIFRHES